MSGRVLTRAAYTAVEREVRSAGSTTAKAEQRQRRGEGLHESIDPSKYDVIRRSISWLEPMEDHFVLERGVAMAVEDRFDTTGSMGENVAIAFRVLPETYSLLHDGDNPVLGRYDLQMATSIFGDVADSYVLQRSQFEMDVRIAEAMTNMFPEHGGSDPVEDPQYGLFAGAFLTDRAINKYELKGYDFTISDAPGRNRIDRQTLVRIFGETVFEKVAESGFQIGKSLPSTHEVVQELLRQTHGFFLQVGRSSTVTRYWTELFGHERVVIIPATKYLPQVQAAIIGLTEGVLSLSDIENYLQEAQVSREDARAIARAVSGIPLGAQASLPNFSKIPLAGAKMAKKGDLWPMVEDVSPGKTVKKPAADKKWL